MAFNAGSIEASLTLNRNAFTAGLRAAKAEAEKFARQKFDVKITPKLDRADLLKIKEQIEKVTGKINVKVALDATSLRALKERIDRTVGSIKVNVSVDATSLAAAKARIERTAGRINAKVDLDTASLNAVKARIAAAVGRMNVKVDLDNASLAALKARIEAANIRIKVKLDVSDADIIALKARLDALRPTIKVRLDIDRSALDRLEGSIRGIGDSGAASFSGMGGQVRAVLALLPLLLSVGGPAIVGLIGLVGALGSALTIAGAGIGAFGLVAAGAFKKITDYGKDAAQAQTGLASASKAVASAQEGLASAVRSAAVQIEAANRRVGDAERTLTRAQADAKQAQLNLNAARKQAVRDLEDLKLSLRGAALSEEQAMLDLQEAQLRYNEALKAGTSGLELKQLELNVRQAQLAVDESGNSFKNLKEDSDAASKAGINGSKGVVTAQGQVNDANEKVSDAERNLAEARADASRAHVEANASIAKAQRELADAQKGYGAALKESVKALSPELMKAYNALESLKKAYDALIERTSKPVSLAMVAAFKAAEAFLRTIDPIVIATAQAFETVGKKIEKYFGGPVWKTFVDFLTANVNPTLTKMFDIIGSIVQGVMNLVIAFNPLTQWMLDAMVKGAKDFQDWTAKIGKDEGFQNFLKLAKESLPQIFHFLGGVIELIMKLALGLAPFGIKVLDILNKVLDWINNTPNDKLAAIAIGLGSVMAALILGAGGPVALGIGALAGLVVILSDLYDKNENVRKSFNDLITWIDQKWTPIWDQIKTNFELYIKPAFMELARVVKEELWPALQDFGKVLGEQVGPTIKPLVDSLTGGKGLIPALVDFLTTLVKVATWILEHWGPDIAATFRDTVTIITGAFTFISGALTTFSGLFTGDWDKFGKGLKTVAEGFWTIIAGVFGTNFEGLKKQFHDWDVEISDAWAKFWSGIKQNTNDGTGDSRTVFRQWLDDLSSITTTKTGDMETGWEKFWSGISQKSALGQDDNRTKFHQWLDDTSAYLNQVDTAMDTAWNTFWAGFSARTQQGGDDNRNAIRIAFDAISLFISQTATNITTTWNDFWGGVSRLTNDFCNAIQLRIGQFGPWITQRIQEAAAAIGLAWRAVANFFKDPINWVIDIVINRGILGAWNTVMGWIGQPALKADTIPPIPGYATGGRVVGPGSGTSDSIPALLSAGEFVVTAKQAKQHEHFLTALNSGQAEAIQAAGGGNNPNAYPRYQAGGPVDAGLNFARAQTGKPYVWGGVGPGGYDCSGFMSAIANVLLGRNPYSRLGTTASAPWPGWNPNLTSQFGVGFFHGTGSTQSTTGHMAGTLAGTNVESGSGHGPMTGGFALGAMSRQFGGHMSLPQAGGAFVGGGAGIIPAVISMWEKYGGQATSLFNGLLNFASMPGNGSLIGNAITQIPIGLVGKALAALKTKLSALFTTVEGTPSAAGGAGGAGVTADVRAVANRYGWGTGVQWNDLSMLIQKESSWNPAAANPTSSARGLFQKMTSIHGPLEPTVTGQAEWGLNYIKNRYNDPAGAWAHELKYGWYDKGGMIGQGISPINTGSHAERVLSPQQTADFHTLVGMLSELVNGRSGGGGLGGVGDTINVMLPAGASVRELANEIDFRKRVASKGRYCPR